MFCIDTSFPKNWRFWRGGR